MLGLKLREEFSGKRITGTTIDFTNRHGTGALDRPAKDFLKITYPSIDLLKTIEAVQPGQARPTVLIGARGQGKSHLMAAVSHMLTVPDVGEQWLNDWATTLNDETLTKLSLRGEMLVVAESLHLQNYKFLWDMLFERHPEGSYIKGKWEGHGSQKTDIPGYDLILEMLQKKPMLLILDEFQTWYEGLTNSKQYPWRNWAYNFIQILSEISENNPELLSLIVSVREGDSDAAQQIYRVNPVRIDFKGPQAKRDRQRLLLYRIFENRMNIPASDIENCTKVHVDEFLRLRHIPGSEHEKHRNEFVEAWPFSPDLLQLLDDQVLIATDAQETRDLLRILVDLYKTSGDVSPSITAADFSLESEKSGVASLLDSVANQLHRDLRNKALRNLQAVRDAVSSSPTAIPHLDRIVSTLWIRSLSLEKMAGAEPQDIQGDITRTVAIDDNQFQAELAVIEENSFNIHRKGNRLVFLNEENPQAKLMAHAKNERLFEKGEDISHLADEIRYVLAGAEGTSQLFKVVVLKRGWDKDPWAELEERDHPKNWDNRIPVMVIPSGNASDADLGGWLKDFINKHRNTVRFLLPKQGTENVFYDKNLLVLARAVYLADQWKKADPSYSPLHIKYQKDLRDQLRSRFDRFAILDTWNFAESKKCTFLTTSHNVDGAKILGEIQKIVRRELFIPEEFAELVAKNAKDNNAVSDVLESLKEPMGGGEASIPWLGETETKEGIIRLCAQGKIVINLLGRDLLECKAGETEQDAWHRMKGRLGNGRQLEETTLHEPGTTVTSGGNAPLVGAGGTTPSYPGSMNHPGGGISPGGLFGGTGHGSVGERTMLSSPSTSALSLYGKLEGWGINSGTKVHNLQLSVGDMTGAQLQELLKKLPDGVTYSLDLEKE